MHGASKNLVPEMQIRLSAQNALQLTLTKSSLGLLKNLVDDYLKEREPMDKKIKEEEEPVDETDFPAPETFDAIYTLKNMVQGY